MSINKEYFCEALCSQEYPFVIVETQECVKGCSINTLKDKTCFLKYTENKTLYKEISYNIISDLLSGSYNGEIEKMIQKNISYNITITQGNDLHFISGYAQYMKRIDISTINFRGCENLLKTQYIFNDIEDLIMYKIEHNVTGFKIPIIEYILFLYKNNETIKLNLDVCDNISIIYQIPISIDEDNINQHDPNSSFYNDKCNKYTSESGTDLSLYDRKNNFNLNNMSLCERGCYLFGYDVNTSRIECECRIKNDLTFYNSDTNISDLLIKIEAQKSTSNLDVTSCNVLSKKENIESNPGFYTLIFIMVLFIIIFIIFCVKGYNLLENKIDKVIYKKFDKENKNSNNKKENTKSNNNNKTNDKKIIKETKKHKFKQKKKKANFEILSKNNSSNAFKSKNSKNNLDNKNKRILLNNNITNNNKSNSIFSRKINQKKQENPSLKPDTDYEYKWLSYTVALRYDKRESCEYYCSLIKSKQIFFFTFCCFNDCNSGVIKKLIFFLSFALHYPVNALFFTDTVMHQIYKDEGKFNFKYQLPQILCSAIISTVILRLILHFLVLTDKDVLEVKYQSNKNMAINMKKKKIKMHIN